MRSPLSSSTAVMCPSAVIRLAQPETVYGLPAEAAAFATTDGSPAGLAIEDESLLMKTLLRADPGGSAAEAIQLIQKAYRAVVSMVNPVVAALPPFNERIEFLNLIAVSRWEQNRDQSTDGIESQIEELKKKRAELAASIDDNAGDDELFNVSLSIEISRSEKNWKRNGELVILYFLQRILVKI